MISANELVPLGSLLTRSLQPLVVDPLKLYQEVTVRLWGKGVLRRRHVSGSELSDGRRFVAAEGQFILSRIDARHGANGIVPAELDNAIVTNDFPLFDFDKSRIDPRYFEWFGRTRAFVELCRRASEGTTNRVRLSEDRFLSLTIPLPPLAQQRHIIGVLQSLSAKLVEAQRLQEQVSNEMQALQMARSREIFKSLSAKEVHLESVCSAIIDNLHTTPTYRDGGTIPCIRSPDVGYGTLHLAGALRTDELEYKHRTVRGEPRTNDIVLVREGGGTGKCALVPHGSRFSLGQRVMMLRPNVERVLPEFLLHQLLSPIIQVDQIRRLSKGSAAPHLNIGALRKFPFFLPSLQTQLAVVKTLDTLDSTVQMVSRLQVQTADELSALIPAVLDKYFGAREDLSIAA